MENQNDSASDHSALRTHSLPGYQYRPKSDGTRRYGQICVSEKPHGSTVQTGRGTSLFLQAHNLMLNFTVMALALFKTQDCNTACICFVKMTFLGSFWSQV